MQRRSCRGDGETDKTLIFIFWQEKIYLIPMSDQS
jgi:hypothetical protein